MDKSIIKQSFGKLLNTHGYGFQYSVLKLANELSDKEKSKWNFEASEFPVEVQGTGTRIDFILKLKSAPVYIIAECKRANPAYSNWCFAKAAYVRRNRTIEPLYLECIQHDDNGNKFAAAKRSCDNNKQKAYHIALEVKSDSKGDPCGSRRGVIEEAATQISRGLNGLTKFDDINNILSSEEDVYFLPVIFTTACIWTSDVNLSSANLKDGIINFGTTKLTKEEWIFYQYHLSPGIKHDLSPSKRPKNLGGYMDSEYIRSIFVVTSDGILNFLKWSSEYFYDMNNFKNVEL